ncbi:fatty acid alpha-hydroxylase [Cryptotrichosporon argae]
MGRIFAFADVSKHASRKSCWMSYKGNVYDVTPFLADHPGGDDLLLEYGGKDMGGVMADPTQHVHSNSAYEMLEEYKIGELGGDEKIVSKDWVASVDFQPDETDTVADFNRNKFLDLTKPLLAQVWGAPWTKEYYLSQVHNPRHLKESARLFKWDILEALTRTKWYVVPIVWGPPTIFLFYLSLLQFTDPSITASSVLRLPLPSLPTPKTSAVLCTLSSFFLGNIVWTILEYTMHRFLFHIDYYLPDANWALMLHFLLHGIHHYLPMDRLRLVMPPTLFFILETPFTKLAHVVFPKAVANGVIAGAFAFYILYDCMHYALHHTRLPQYMADMKRYHLAHHYKNFELGFGVTSKIWDVVFNTVLPVNEK